MYSLKGILDSINPTLICRRYEISLMGWFEGHVENFWRLKHAIVRYQNAVSRIEAPFIRLEDTWKNKTLFNYNEKPPTDIHMEVDSVGRHRWIVPENKQYSKGHKERFGE